MASNRAIEAGRAVLRIVAVEEGVRGTLNEIEGVLEQTAARARNVGLAITATGLAGLGSLSLSVNEASRAQEIASKFKEVFGGATEAMRGFFRSMADEVNRSEVDLQEFGAGFQDLLQPIGFDSEAAREYSGVLTKLAVDLASFNNRSDSDAVRDLQAALTGSSETLKRYGVIANETAVKQELLNQGIKKGEATEVDKVYARIAIIMRQTSAAQGDAVRTAASFANQMKGLGSAIRDTSVAIGNALLPIVTPVVSAFRFLVQQARNVADAFPGLTLLAAGVSAAIAAVGAALTVASVAAGFLLSPITLLSIALRVAGTTMEEALFKASRLAASFLSLSGAARAAGAAISGLSAAVKLFVGSTIGGAITAVITAAVVLLPLLSTGLATTASEARAATSELNSFARSVRELESAQQAVKVLQGLSSQSELTAEQQLQAIVLIGELNNRYGDLGIRVNTTTGKIETLGTTFEQLNEKLKGSLPDVLNSQLRETQKNIEALEEAINGVFHSNASDDARTQAIAKFNELIKKAQKEAAFLQGRLDALRASGDITVELTAEEKERQGSFNEQQARRVNDVRIAGIEDERERRIEAARIAARRDFAEAEKVNGDKRVIAQRLALEIEQINRDVDQRVAEQRKRDAEENSRTAANFAGDRREAELRVALEGRDLELALLKETEQEKIRLARERGLATLDIEREFAARRQQVNAQFDKQEKQRGERDAKKQQNELLRVTRGLQIQGTLATRVAGQQFSRGGDSVAENQLTELQLIKQSLRRMERRKSGIAVI